MSHKPSVLYLYPFKISVLFLRMLISFFSSMDIQSLSHNCPKEIIKSLFNQSKMCASLAWMLRLIYSGMPPVFVAFIVSLFGNWNYGPLWVSLMVVSNNMSSVRQ